MFYCSLMYLKILKIDAKEIVVYVEAIILFERTSFRLGCNA